MTQRITSIIYQPTSTVNDACVFVQKCDSSIDSDWVVQTEGTDASGGSGEAIKAKYAIVDNLVNPTSCTINYGVLSFGVAPYTRRTFALPDQAPTVEILLTSGIVTLTLCQNNMQVPDEVNQLLSSGGNTVGEYNPFFFCVGQVPVGGQVLFSHFFEEPVFFQPNFNGFQGGIDKTSGVNPTATYVCTIYKNGIHIGDITYSTGGVATATSIGGTSGTFAVSDCMTILGNAVPDATILNFSGTFTMTPT